MEHDYYQLDIKLTRVPDTDYFRFIKKDGSSDNITRSFHAIDPDINGNYEPNCDEVAYVLNILLVPT